MEFYHRILKVNPSPPKNNGSPKVMLIFPFLLNPKSIGTPKVAAHLKIAVLGRSHLKRKSLLSSTGHACG